MWKKAQADDTASAGLTEDIKALHQPELLKRNTSQQLMTLLLLSPKIDKLVLGNEAAKKFEIQYQAKLEADFSSRLEAAERMKLWHIHHGHLPPAEITKRQELLKLSTEKILNGNYNFKRICFVALLWKKQKQIPKGCSTIMALNKTSQWLNQDHLVCTEKK